VVEWLKGSHPFGSKQIAVKPNNLWSEWGRDDLDAIAGLRMDVLYYPEARSADEVRVVQKALDLAGSEAEIAVLLETPESFLEIQALATVPRATAFNHAQGDLSANLGVALTDTRETLLYTASQLVLVARALLNGQFQGYSQERLIGLLNRLGCDVRIVVTPKPRSRAVGRVSVAFA